jgi:broad specificity phosphatase PhoE
VESLIVCRHAESEFNVRGVINGDPSNAGGLSERGRDHARALGATLAARTIDLCVTTEFERTIETADIALAGRFVPRLVMPELSDSPLGIFELRPFEEFNRWRRAHGPDVVLPGTDVSERSWLGRIRGAFGVIAERPETTILAILHGACVSWLLGSAGRSVDPGYATPLELSGDELLNALAVTRKDVYARWPRAVDVDP